MAKLLLSSSDDREIRDAVQLLADTFFDTPIGYYKHIPTMDAYNEDKPNQQFKLYQIKALVEYSNLGHGKEENAGSRNLNEVKLTLNLEDLARLSGLINTENEHQFSAEKDYFKCKGKIYKLENVYYDAPLSAKDILIIMQGRLTDKSNFKLV